MSLVSTIGVASGVIAAISTFGFYFFFIRAKATAKHGAQDENSLAVSAEREVTIACRTPGGPRASSRLS